MLLYRYENDCGVGPYRSCIWSMREMSSAHNDPSHPSPSQCGIPTGFCFMYTLESLKTWFDGYEDLLIRQGYTISVYDVPTELCRISNVGQVTVDSETFYENRRDYYVECI